ncbi:MAG: hypothetical protein GJU77_07830 [Ferrovum sp.]|jgi:hypothetical protein|nr:hypothetical protein [Ferrovum sp.]NDU90874.1 hypothetical protein [Ferrovum sp.]
MDEAENMKLVLKKLNAQATASKMDLHDLSEDLPTGWERIMEVAQKTFTAYQNLNEMKNRMAGG